MPICLPELDTTVLPDTMCVITGFGRTQGTANEKVLNQQTLPIVSNTKVFFGTFRNLIKKGEILNIGGAAYSWKVFCQKTPTIRVISTIRVLSSYTRTAGEMCSDWPI
jgi:hypothetical protein